MILKWKRIRRPGINVVGFCLLSCLVPLMVGGCAPQNRPPSAIVTASPTSGKAPLEVLFDASRSHDPDGDKIVSYHWDFGDRKRGAGPTIVHGFGSPGKYAVRLTLVDEKGSYSTKDLTILVIEPAKTVIEHEFDTRAGTEWDAGIGLKVRVPPSSAQARAKLVVKSDSSPSQPAMPVFVLHSSYTVSIEGYSPPPGITLRFGIPSDWKLAIPIVVEWTDDGWVPARNEGGVPGGDLSPDRSEIVITRNQLSTFALGRWQNEILELLSKVPEIPPQAKLAITESTVDEDHGTLIAEVELRSPYAVELDLPLIGRTGVAGMWYCIDVAAGDDVLVDLNGVEWLHPGENRKVKLVFPPRGGQATVSLRTGCPLGRAALNWLSRLGLPDKELTQAISGIEMVIRRFEATQKGLPDFRELVSEVRSFLLGLLRKAATSAHPKLFLANSVPVAADIAAFILGTLNNRFGFREDPRIRVEARDVVPPTAPTDLVAIAASSTQIDLTWTAATDHVGVAGYKVYRNGSYIGSTTRLSYSDTGLIPSTRYCYTVSAYDAAGNESQRSIQTCTTTLAKTPASGIAGVYTCIRPGTYNADPWMQDVDRIMAFAVLNMISQEGNTIELKEDGAFRCEISYFGSMPDGPRVPFPLPVVPTLTGDWKLKGKELTLHVRSYVFTTKITGELVGRMIVLEDGSIWAWSPVPPPAAPAKVAGTYICDRASSAQFAYYIVFEKGDTLELKSDGTLCLTNPKGGPIITGKWKVEADEIILRLEVAYMTVEQTGTIKNNTIVLRDGSTWTRTGEQHGSHGGNPSIPLPVPLPPTKVHARVVSPTQIDLAWVASADDGEVTSYNVFRNGVFLANVSGTSYSDKGLTPSTRYCYTVSAVNAVGNESPQADAVCAITLHGMLSGHTDEVWSIAFSPDGKLLASGCRDKTIKLWDVITGKEVSTLVGHTSIVTSVAFSPDGKLLASSSVNEVKIWDVARRREVRTLFLSGHVGARSVAFTPDGKLLAAGGCGEYDPTKKAEICRRGEIRLWDVATGNVIRSISEGHNETVMSVGFSPDGKLLFSRSCDRDPNFVREPRQVIKLWDVATGREVRSFTTRCGSGQTAFSPDGKLLASSSGRAFGPYEVNLWNVATGKEVRTLVDNYFFAFSPNEKLIATGHWKEDVVAGKAWVEIKLWDVATGRELRAFPSPCCPVSVAFSPDGKLLAAGYSADRTIKLWDVSDLVGRWARDTFHGNGQR